MAGLFCTGLLLTLPSLVCAEKIFNVADPYLAFHGLKGRMAEPGYRDSKSVRYRYYYACGDEKLLRSLAGRRRKKKSI